MGENSAQPFLCLEVKLHFTSSQKSKLCGNILPCIWWKLRYGYSRVHISGVTKCVAELLTLLQWGVYDSVKNFATPEMWTLILYQRQNFHFAALKLGRNLLKNWLIWTIIIEGQRTFSWNLEQLSKVHVTNLCQTAPLRMAKKLALQKEFG